MGVQRKIDALLEPACGLGGLPVDRAMLGIALRLGSEGGKRFRPWLFAAVHEQLTRDGVRDGDAPVASQDTLDTIAASLELLHSAFVIHDDVIDNDDTRRGHASVPGWFRGSTATLSQTYARAGAILTGDLALAAAVRGFATCGASPEVTGRLLDLLDAILQDSAVGELADVRLSSSADVPDLEEALSVAELKTAAYSFVLPMQAAAIVAGAQGPLVEQVGEVGRALGVAFQLRDDLMGMFSDVETTGKDPLGDLREGKRTPLVVHAAQTPQWRRIRPHLGDLMAGEAELAEVRDALVESGSLAFVEDLIGRHLRRARRHAGPLGLEEPVVNRLTSSWELPTPAEPEVVEVAAVAEVGVA